MRKRRSPPPPQQDGAAAGAGLPSPAETLKHQKSVVNAAQTKLTRGQADEALEDIEALLRDYPKHPGARLLQARIIATLGLFSAKGSSSKGLNMATIFFM